MKRSLAAVPFAAVVVSCLLEGCAVQEMVPADQVVAALFDLSVKDNAVPMQELLGFPTEEDARKAFIDESQGRGIAAVLIEDFEEMGLELSHLERARLGADMKGMVNKLECTASVVSQEGDHAQVSLKVTGYAQEDMDRLSRKTQEQILEDLDEEETNAILSEDEDQMEEVMEKIAGTYIDGLAQLEPSAVTEISVDCVRTVLEIDGRKKQVWLPDMEEFQESLEEAIIK